MKYVKRKKLWFLGLIISLSCALYFTVKSYNLNEMLKETAAVTYAMPEGTGDTRINTGGLRVDSNLNPIPTDFASASVPSSATVESADADSLEECCPEDADLLAYLDELDRIDAEYGTMSAEKRAERSRRIREWQVKFDDFTARQDAFHEKMMAETDVAISLISRFVGAVLNLVPDDAEGKLREVVAQRAAEEGASPSGVVEFMDNAERTTENPVSVAADLQELAESANSEQDLQQLSEEHKKLMAELREILSS